MNWTDLEITQYHSCRDLYGNVRPVALCKRNGRTALCFDPGFGRSGDEAGNGRGDVEGIFDNLTEIESEAWERVLEGRSISQIAEEQGVSRTAIYERIRGNSKGQGGMIAKNHWVRLWWTARKELSENDQLS